MRERDRSAGYALRSVNGHNFAKTCIFNSMTGRDLKQGERAKVESVTLPPELKERLRYLSVYDGATLLLLKRIFKKTFLLQAESCKFAVSREVAEGIKVCKIQYCS